MSIEVEREVKHLLRENEVLSRKYFEAERRSRFLAKKLLIALELLASFGEEKEGGE